MSTFNGIIHEIKGISIDRFVEHNLTSSVYFLSHCHSDHMVGLWDVAHSSKGLEGPLYLSSVSALFVKHHYPALQSNLQELEIGYPTIIEISSNENKQTEKVKVTALPAGHCPGSVMFLFETADKTILYTGDFRLPGNTIKKMKSLHDSSGNPIKFDHIYLDTTFMNRLYTNFPTQFESFEELFKIIQQWITKSDSHIIFLKTPARYGSEYIYIELAKRLKIKIHVDQYAFNKYCCIPEMDQSVTTSLDTRIHACYPACQFDRKTKHVKTVKPSALYWTNVSEKNPKISILDELKNEHRVCYSSHASFNELKMFLNYFKPEKVFACVAPENEEPKIKKLLAQLKKEVRSENTKCLEVQLPDVSADVQFVMDMIKRQREEKCTEINTCNDVKRIKANDELWNLSEDEAGT